MKKLFVLCLTFTFVVLCASSLLAQKSETYEVVKGDYLAKISKKQYSDYKFWPVIWEANRNGVVNKDKLDREKYKTIPNPNLIFVGQVLKIPKDPKISADLEKEAWKSAKKYWKKTHRVKKVPTDEVKKDEKKDEKKDVKKDTKKDEKKDVKKETPKK